MEYDVFSSFYDTLTGDVGYKKRAAYLLKIFKKYSIKPKILLDLGCGTGNFAFEFLKKNIDVIGVDKSEGMLSEARNKAEKLNKSVLFLNQSGDELDLYGTVDGAVCCLDTVNHIISKTQLKKTFEKVSLFLEKGCLFIFDVNTLYKQEKVLGNNTFTFEKDGVFCVWRNGFSKMNKTTEISLEFFKKDGENYKRYSEKLKERVYSDKELTEIAEKCGFSKIAVFEENTFNPIKDDTERAVYVLRKIK